LSADSTDGYLAAGMTDELASALVRVGDFKVVSRSATQNAQATGATLVEIGRALSVAYLLEGTVQRQGDRVRVTTRLVDATQRLSALRREDETAVDMLPLSALNRRLGQISECAERSSLKVTSTRPGESRQYPHFVAVPLSLGGDCTFASFVGFLRDLRREAPDVSVESFELTAVRSTEGAASAAFHVQAVWHARKDPEDRKDSQPENTPAGG
jgi:hypothetical protein